MKTELEEAAERLYPTTIDSFTDTGIDVSETERLIFISGAKWQAEKSYSEEEVINLIKIIEWYDEHSDVRPNYTPDVDERIGNISMWDWFEQFKKSVNIK